MHTTELSFLQAKIESLGTALFFCDNQSVLPFSAFVVTALKTDEDGNIWFFISRSWEQAARYDTLFPGQLEFYRKGCLFTLTVNGHASLVDDKEAIQHFMQDLLGKSMPVKQDAIQGVLLVKVKIEKAVYKALAPRKQSPSFQQLFSGIKNVWGKTNPQYSLQYKFAS